MNQKVLFGTLCVLPVWLSAQHVVVSPTVEKTINSCQYGTSVSMEVPSQWGFGCFYQTSLSKQEKIRPREPFWGIAVSAPLIKADRITFYTNARIGIVNKYYMVVCPAVVTELKILNRLHIGIGMFIRRGHLSGKTAINIKI